jgi:trimeric autotransporter adhesin
MRRIAATAAVALALAGCADRDPAAEPARHARDFGDSLGVNIKTAYLGTPFENYAKVKEALFYTGILHYRDGLWWPPSNGGAIRQKPFFRELNAAGIKGTLGFGCVDTYNELGQKFDHMRDENLFAVVEAWENPNEVNHPHSACSTANWQQNARNHAARLYWEVKTRGLTQPIIAPSCGGSPCEHEIADLYNVIDWGNYHPYRGQGIPETAVQEQRPNADRLSREKPDAITEFGWQIPQWAATERVQALYTMRAFLDYYHEGTPRSYLHQLVDCCDGLDGFGLYNENWTPKRAAHAMHNLTTILQTGLPRVANPGSLSVGWQGWPDDMDAMLFRSRDYFSIVGWRAVPAQQNGADSFPPIRNVTVRFGTPPARVRMFNPYAGTAAQQTWTRPQQVTVGIGAGPIILTVVP